MSNLKFEHVLPKCPENRAPIRNACDKFLQKCPVPLEPEIIGDIYRDLCTAINNTTTTEVANLHSYLFHKPYLDIVLPIALETIYAKASTYEYLPYIENYDRSLPDCYARFTDAPPLLLITQIMSLSQSFEQTVSFILKYAYPMLFRPKVNVSNRRFVCLDPYILVDLDKNTYVRLEDIAKIPNDCYTVDTYHCTEATVYNYFPANRIAVSVRQSLLFFLSSFEYLAYDLEFVVQLLRTYESVRERTYVTRPVSNLDLLNCVDTRGRKQDCTDVNVVDVSKLPREDVAEVYKYLVNNIRLPVKLTTLQSSACDGFTVEVILFTYYGDETKNMLRKILPLLKENVCKRVHQAPFIKKNPGLIPYLYVSKVEMSAPYICTFTVQFKGNTDYGRYIL